MSDLSEILSILDSQGKDFEKFKAKVNADYMELAKKQNRPSFPDSDGGVDDYEHTKAFNTWARSGRGEDTLAALQSKGMNTGADPDGGYAVPLEVDRTIDSLLRDISPIRRVARTVQTGTADYRKLVRTSGPASGWVGELEARTETTGAKFAAIVPPLGEIYSNPAVSQNMLDDSFFDLSQWLADEMSENFAMEEGAAFINGTGIDQPRGFLTYDVSTDVDADRGFGTIQYIASGASGAFTSSAPADQLIDLMQSLRPAYRQGASWVMNSSTLGTVRKLKDGNDNYLWQDNLQAGEPGTLLGYPVIEAEDMPDISADSLSIAFGNYQRGYTIVDRMGTRLLRDPYTAKPNVLFYATKRVGGGLVNSEAIKVMKFATG
ncbi:MAG: phage major capsid protein [Candidatus Sedimenticola sp. 6PFRAG7]